MALAIDRFWQAVEKTDTCWLWKRPRADGYGRLFLDRHRAVMAHRFSYEVHVGKIPNGLQIDHLCRVRNCVNPAHLELVTGRENVLRGEGTAAKRARQTHCVNGHRFTNRNTYVNSKGHRTCKRCRADRMRKKVSHA